MPITTLRGIKLENMTATPSPCLLKIDKTRTHARKTRTHARKEVKGTQAKETNETA